MALALTISVYLWALDMGITYTARADLMLMPKNIKTAVYLNDAKKNLETIFKESSNANDGIEISTFGENSLIRVEATDENKQLAIDLLRENLISFLGISSKYYDIKNDLSIEFVNRVVVKNRKSTSYLLLISVISGLGLSFLLQILLNTIERIAKKSKNKEVQTESVSNKIHYNLKNILNLNKEKIEKLSEDSISPKVETRKSKENQHKKGEENNDIEEMENKQAVFKKASFPSNLPVASIEEEDNKKSSGFGEHTIVSKTSEGNDEKEDKSNEEPTEEEFKKRLNQLLSGE